MIVGFAFAIPGVLGGLLLGLLPRSAVEALLAVLGAATGIGLGIWVERN